MNKFKSMQIEFENDLLENWYIENNITKQEFEIHKRYLSEARLLDKIQKSRQKPISKLLKISPDIDEKIKLLAEKNKISYTQLANILLDSSLEVLQTK